MRKSRKSSKAKGSGRKVPPITREEILAARAEFGMTQRALAESFGVSEITVARWESKNNPVTPDTPGAIRMAFEHMRTQRILDESELLRSLDQRVADMTAMRDRIKRGQKQRSRSRSTTGAKSGRKRTLSRPASRRGIR
jgi:transcriptional regulator with XRE-family HTH domain